MTRGKRDSESFEKVQRAFEGTRFAIELDAVLRDRHTLTWSGDLHISKTKGGCWRATAVHPGVATDVAVPLPPSLMH